METTDFLVIGSGLAGLSFALEVADFGQVLILCKEDVSEGNSLYAQGGIASVTDPEDTFEDHTRDTLIAGAGLCNEDIVRLVVEEAPHSIEFLVQHGVEFDRAMFGNSFELGKEGGHSKRRILHIQDRTGAHVHRSLVSSARAHPNIRFLTHQVAIDLIRRTTTSGSTEVVGAYVLDKKSSEISTIAARAVMLATGGAGKTYLYTSNPDVATGDGIAMAYRAGATVANMEFFQFHPTCLYHPKAKSFLITEAMRGEGARLLTPAGEPFMPRYDSRLDLAPRDIIARAIDTEMKTNGYDYVLLDISFRDREFIQKRFPNVYERALQFGLDITKEPIPVVPAAHYCCGGVLSDRNGTTNLRRLYVAGESACTGLHGANRLASNSLLECVVFARRAAQHLRSHNREFARVEDVPEWDYLNTVKSSEEVLVSYYWDEVRRVMWNLVGISRSDKRLLLARRRLKSIQQEVADYYWKYLVTSDLIELRNILQVSQLIVTMAYRRRESRGLHFNVNCPETDDIRWKRDSVMKGASA